MNLERLPLLVQREGVILALVEGRIREPGLVFVPKFTDVYRRHSKSSHQALPHEEVVPAGHLQFPWLSSHRLIF